MRYGREALMARPLLAGLGYVGAMAVWIYWVAERQLFWGSETANIVLTVLLAGTHLATGLLAARRWALLLPLVAVVLALPTGYPDANRGEPLPIPVAVTLFAPFGVLLIGAGVLGTRLGRRRWRRRGPTLRSS